MVSFPFITFVAAACLLACCNEAVLDVFQETCSAAGSSMRKIIISRRLFKFYCLFCRAFPLSMRFLQQQQLFSFLNRGSRISIRIGVSFISLRNVNFKLSPTSCRSFLLLLEAFKVSERKLKFFHWEQGIFILLALFALFKLNLSKAKKSFFNFLLSFPKKSRKLFTVKW